MLQETSEGFTFPSFFLLSLERVDAMEPHLYFHGYDYSTGVLAAGAPCVAPILELTNKLPEEMHISWLNRTLIGDDVLSSDPSALCSYFSNHVTVGVGELTLITNFYASSGFYRSLLLLESASSGVDIYVLNFSGEIGYFLTRVLQLCSTPCDPVQFVETCSCDNFTKAVVEYTPFSPSFKGGQVPKWKDCVILPVVVRRVASGQAAAHLPCILRYEPP